MLFAQSQQAVPKKRKRLPEESSCALENYQLATVFMQYLVPPTGVDDPKQAVLDVFQDPAKESVRKAGASRFDSEIFRAIWSGCLSHTKSFTSHGLAPAAEKPHESELVQVSGAGNTA